VVKRAFRWLLTRLQGGQEPDGFTVMGRTIWFIDDPSPGLIAHEAYHRHEQRRLWYVGHAARYLYWYARHGYQNHPEEVEARRIQDHVNGDD